MFVIFNILFFAANLIDVGYFPFTRKRASSELFDQLGGQTDVLKLLPQFMIDFWWIVFSFLLLCSLVIRLYNRLQVDLHLRSSAQSPGYYVWSWLLFSLSVCLCVLGVRGGLQRVPIDIVNAGSMTRPEETAIVLNTPFSLIKSLSQKSLVEFHFYSEEEVRKIYNPIHHFKDSTFKKQNVVVLILESFSKEYTKLGKRQSITPFLDSLMDHSLVFANAYSNGSKSIEGIPAILAGLPSLMANPVINSIYANNEHTSLAYLLNKEGYECSFFHGGINGTMNFDDWAKLAGYKNYFGKNEYKNDEDFDNYWGIWDEPFLQYSIRKMNEMQQPFHSAIFTLSSHHPYFVPKKFVGKFPKTKLENSESIGYADYSLRQFFISAQKTNWYHNTLFVLVADHCGISEDPFYSRVVGNSAIPILFYKGDNSLAGTHEQSFSQTDILPSVLQELGYNKPFFSFGEPFMEKQEGNCFYFSGSTHYFFGDSMVYAFDVPKLRQAFNYRRDSILALDIAGKNTVLDSLYLRRYKAFIQTYNSTLIHNTGRVKN